jgi:hypothetical protein
MPSPVHPYSDYGVALRTLRSARSWLGFLLLVCVIWQFVGFALMYWTHHPYKGSKATWTWPANLDEARARLHGKVTASPATVSPTTAAAVAAASQPEPFFPGTEETRQLNIREQWVNTYTMAVPLTQLASLMAVSSQTIILFITLLVVLVAQAPGVAQLTRSLIWSVLLLFMFLPWQSFFTNDFPIPGVIYNYNELIHRIAPIVADAPHDTRAQIFIVYARFVVWPLIGLLVLLITAERFRAGIMIAIGHPLQSMLQPRTGAGTPGKPGPLGPLPIPNPEKKLL